MEKTKQFRIEITGFFSFHIDSFKFNEFGVKEAISNNAADQFEQFRFDLFRIYGIEWSYDASFDGRVPRLLA